MKISMMLAFPLAALICWMKPVTVSGKDENPPSSAQLKQEIFELKALVKKLENIKLSCMPGKKQNGKVNQWSTWSQCQPGYVATGMQRIDLLGSHEIPTNHVNDFECNDNGCRAWCIGSPCNVEARCCRVAPTSSASAEE
ncbi:MAG: hypothetical protein HQK54_11765 [Oligoflexales bacterium]|nr:hypothetical protein [Oligoflexales bacterium]